MNRYTFVVQVQPDGPSTIENLSTHERVGVSDLDAVGPQIERWLSALEAQNGLVTSAGSGDTDGSSDEG